MIVVYNLALWAVFLAGAAVFAHDVPKSIAGVPVYNYDALSRESGVSVQSASDKAASAKWMVVMKPGKSKMQAQSMESSEGGVPFVTVSSTEKELEDLLKRHPGEVDFVEPEMTFTIPPMESHAKHVSLIGSNSTFPYVTIKPSKRDPPYQIQPYPWSNIPCPCYVIAYDKVGKKAFGYGPFLDTIYKYGRPEAGEMERQLKMKNNNNAVYTVSADRGISRTTTNLKSQGITDENFDEVMDWLQCRVAKDCRKRFGCKVGEDCPRCTKRKCDWFKAGFRDSRKGLYKGCPDIPGCSASTEDLKGQVTIHRGSETLWGLDRIDQRQGTNSRYFAPLDGKGVHVYVIDTGIRTEHSDFGGRAFPAVETWTGKVRACDKGSVSCACGKECRTHFRNHGTHVAGTVGGLVSGVAKGVTLHSVQTRLHI